MKKNIFFIGVILLSGCITNGEISKDFSSGIIGCPSQEIKITNETAKFGGTHSWTAECRGEKFICNYHTTTGANCTKALSK